MRRRVSSLIAFSIVLSSFVGGMPSAPAGPVAEPIYVSLGDSLAVGYQPGQGETRKGYVDVLWRAFREEMPTLVRQKLGCAGETSGSLITGDGSPCDYAEGSQLDAAATFIASHGGQVPFITIDVGANDIIEGCLDFDTAELDRTCVEDLVPALQDNVTEIVGALRKAAGPDVPIIGMTYYNPLLGLWVIPHGHSLARKAQRTWEVFNAALTEAYQGAGAVVADVAATFKIDEWDETAILDGKLVPLNVARACRWTWFCSDEAFGDPHANAIGYRKIARTFQHVLEPLLA